MLNLILKKKIEFFNLHDDYELIEVLRILLTRRIRQSKIAQVKIYNRHGTPAVLQKDLQYWHGTSIVLA